LLFHAVVPYFSLLVSGFSAPRSTFDNRPVCGKFMAGKVALGMFFTEYFGFRLSLSFHQCLTDLFPLLTTVGGTQ